ncbi:AzlD domain-containing protein [Falsirhodobacter halotolerans]|uniref:AzlD domain-containing protein n=1 Tax=Falsirhodobacter halotolerans TaxID=1146892 RepID=UPI001FD50472|nr:AzlD domain-containing protein [Falsirhodobacter halotolerans]MCJ8140505.1 AzlD domain-containing protein [Falsirhodobacter halotolerans]
MSDLTLWTVILGLGVGTFLFRFSFLALRADAFPEWALRLLRYTPVAVLPGLIAPMVIWPQATGGETDPARLAAAVATAVVGLWTRSVLWGILGGGITLYTLLWALQ